MHRTLALAALTVLLAACGSGTTGLGGTGTGSREILQLTTPTLPVAYVEEDFAADLQVTGGLNPYTLRVVSGTLPPGVTLRGTRLSGRPTKEGRYEFTVEATDASLATRSRTYAVNVGTLPPLAVAPELPRGSTEFRADTRVPLNINHPRGTRAMRFQWRLPEGARVTGVQPGDGNPILLWKQTGQLLTVDAGFPNAPASGSRVALVALSFDKPVKLDASQVAFDARDAEGKAVAAKPLPAERGTTPQAQPGATPAQPGATPAQPGTAPAQPATPPAEGEQEQEQETPATPAQPEGESSDGAETDDTGTEATETQESGTEAPADADDAGEQESQEGDTTPETGGDESADTDDTQPPGDPEQPEGTDQQDDGSQEEGQ